MIEILREAEGYLELGMINEARDATETLEPLDRCEPLTVEMRLRIATAGEKWQLGEALANVLICSEIEQLRCQKTCARFHHANARRLIREGLDILGKAEIQKAVEAWPNIRKEMIDGQWIWSVFD